MNTRLTRKHLLVLASYAPSLLNFRGPLIRELVESGNQVSVGAPDITPELRGELEAIGAKAYQTPLQRTGMGLVSDFRYWVLLWQLMGRIKPDLVLTYTIKPNIWGAFAAAARRIRSVSMVTGLGYAFTEPGNSSWRHWVVRRVARWLYRAATTCNWRVVFQNPDDRDDFLAARCLTDREKIRLVDGSGVDVAHYRRSALPDAPVFLMVARLLCNKGVREYANASLRLLKEYPGTRCLLAGPFDEGPDGISRSELDRWVAGGLEYLGPQDDVRTAFRSARFYVLPSYREGTPRSVLEAMSMGRAVITTDAPGCRETIRDGVEGYLVPVRDEESLVAAMVRMVEDPQAAEVMAEAAYRRALGKYDVRMVNRQMFSVLGLDIDETGS